MGLRSGMRRRRGIIATQEKKLRFELLEERTLLTTYTVRQSLDTGNVLNVDTLSWAIEQVNQDGSGTINFAVDEVTLFNGTQPAITASPVTVDGVRGTGRVTLRSDASTTEFAGLKVATNGIATIKNIKITAFEGNAIDVTSGTTITIDNVILSSSLRGILFVAQSSLALTNSYIYANSAEGVLLQTTGGIIGSVSTISNNGIGRTETGAGNGNGYSGIYVGSVSRDVRIVDNDIWNNGFAGGTRRNDGISIVSTSTSNGVEISNSSTYSFRNNTHLAIDLDDNLITDIPGERVGGVNFNDPGDSDTGANNLLNYPEIVRGGNNPGGSWNVQVRYDTDQTGEYTFDLYKFNPAAKLYTFLKRETKTVASLQNGPDLAFDTNLSAGLFTFGDQITAVAVGGITAGPNYRRTSEFAPPASVICVSTTIDEFDQDLSFGDLSLREAVNYANTAGVPTIICLPAGTYSLTITGTGGVSQGDLDVTGNVTIVGDGPGLSIIDASTLATHDRIFDVTGTGILNVSRVTLELGYAPNTAGLRDGGAVRIQNGGEFNLDYSAVVGNLTDRSGDGGAVYFYGLGKGSIRNSVITLNTADDNTGGVYLASNASGQGGEVRVANSIIVNNSESGSTFPDVYAGTNRQFTSEGYNRLGNAATGFVHNVNGDYISTGATVHYVVTSIADTFDDTPNALIMSLRDAIYQANIAAGTQEIWLPAWKFVLTMQRITPNNQVEMNVSEGDLEILQSTIVRGIGPVTSPKTSVGWAPGLSDKIFELVGDYNLNMLVEDGGGDYVNWRNQENQTGSNLQADGDDDGDVDLADKALYQTYAGNTLTLDSVLLA